MVATPPASTPSGLACSTQSKRGSERPRGA